jgi:hypothetical protein
MNNQEYLNNYFGGIQAQMDKDDYTSLHEELQKFKQENLNLPESQFRKILKDEYGDLLATIRMKSSEKLLFKINNKLQIFLGMIIASAILTALLIALSKT